MIAGKFLDPKNDFAFKKIFGTEKNKDILVHFLNDILSFKKEKRSKMSPTLRKMNLRSSLEMILSLNKPMKFLTNFLGPKRSVTPMNAKRKAS